MIKRLIGARKARGWTQVYLASQLAVSSITVSRWENGIQVPQVYCVHQLCQIFGLTDKELGFTFCQNITVQEYRMVYEEMDSYFTFGKIKTSEIILDGDGTGMYLSHHVHSHYIPVALELSEEIQTHKERIAHEQEERKAQGDSYQWNGERYNLVKFNIGRDPVNEDMILGLWFRPSDYYTFLATSDIYRCAIRGLAEEPGLHAPVDFSPSDIQFLSFAVDTEFCMWGLFGTVKLQRRAEEVLENLRRSVRDRFESRRVFSVPFTPEEVCSFVFSHEPFSPGGLVCLYHALVHEFGSEQVNSVISSY